MKIRFALGANASWLKIANGKQNYRVLPRRNLEPLERIYGRFPSVDHSGRFARVPNLGKPQYIERENRLQYKP